MPNNKQPQQFDDSKNRRIRHNSNQPPLLLHRLHWMCPQAPIINCESDELMFQQMDIRVEFCNGEEIVIMIGTTIEGYSVMCRVCGFRLYFYICAPNTVQRDNLPLLVAWLQWYGQAWNHSLGSPLQRTPLDNNW
ncbi:hypothetical protein BC938DRAFT_483941 [Jimgerdemannia flammicorona]|uniref:Uncharacterized protein n=1 Tax=Jimgerdemannia flammicorona TaxID=994334 RepID=A0A433R090_9FUNG|nr:hypothetical protein BC938DRAFT_483941 [Jimgerdemannia flammicorona]